MEQILFFDGVCNLCNGTVQWILRHDSKKTIVFAALQSDSARLKLVPLGVDIAKLESLILFEDGVVYSHSDAVLRVARAMGTPWSWTFFLRFVPKFVRDGLYRFIAKNRYAWFGRQDSCTLPTPELKKRFLS
jgi:predicted DCC family thiol-disulfide oxidoreductase YuxK